MAEFASGGLEGSGSGGLSGGTVVGGAVVVIGAEIASFKATVAEVKQTTQRIGSEVVKIKLAIDEQSKTQVIRQVQEVQRQVASATFSGLTGWGQINRPSGTMGSFAMNQKIGEAIGEAAGEKIEKDASSGRGFGRIANLFSLRGIESLFSKAGLPIGGTLAFAAIQESSLYGQMARSQWAVNHPSPIVQAGAAGGMASSIEGFLTFGGWAPWETRWGKRARDMSDAAAGFALTDQLNERLAKLSFDPREIVKSHNAVTRGQIMEQFKGTDQLSTALSQHDDVAEKESRFTEQKFSSELNSMRLQGVFAGMHGQAISATLSGNSRGSFALSRAIERGKLQDQIERSKVGASSSELENININAPKIMGAFDLESRLQARQFVAAQPEALSLHAREAFGMGKVGAVPFGQEQGVMDELTKAIQELTKVMSTKGGSVN